MLRSFCFQQNDGRQHSMQYVFLRYIYSQRQGEDFLAAGSQKQNGGYKRCENYVSIWKRPAEFDRIIQIWQKILLHSSEIV